MVQIAARHLLLQSLQPADDCRITLDQALGSLAWRLPDQL